MCSIFKIQPMFCWWDDDIQYHRTVSLDSFQFATFLGGEFWKSEIFYRGIVEATSDHIKTQFPYREYLDLGVICNISMKLLAYFPRGSDEPQIVELTSLENTVNILPPPPENATLMIAVTYDAIQN